jgi:hypothetical protein
MQPTPWVTESHVLAILGLDVAVLVWTGLALLGIVTHAPAWLSITALILFALFAGMVIFDPPGVQDDD